MKPILLPVVALALSGCAVTVGPATQPSGTPSITNAPGSGNAGDSFSTVVSRVEPVAESLCRSQRNVSNCDYKIIVDNRAGQPANAYQTVDDNGRPVIIFTAALLDETRNADEIAFVMGHEAAHHIEGHIPRKQQNTAAGAALAGLLVASAGGNSDAIRTAQELGAFAGSRQYSKDYELEADSMGTVIAYRSGYDPLKGAEYFSRIPDPGDMFLGSHPPNADRMRTVRQTAAGLK